MGLLLARGETNREAFASPENEPRPVPSREGGGLLTGSPSPYPPQREVWQILKGGLDSLALNDYGRPWPNPRRDVIAELVATHDHDLCVRAAREAREIVQSQDRAPNITALFAKKLEEVAEVRSTVRESLAGVS